MNSVSCGHSPVIYLIFKKNSKTFWFFILSHQICVDILNLFRSLWLSKLSSSRNRMFLPTHLAIRTFVNYSSEIDKKLIGETYPTSVMKKIPLLALDLWPDTHVWYANRVQPGRSDIRVHYNNLPSRAAAIAAIPWISTASFSCIQVLRGWLSEGGLRAVWHLFMSTKHTYLFTCALKPTFFLHNHLQQPAPESASPLVGPRM